MNDYDNEDCDARADAARMRLVLLLMVVLGAAIGFGAWLVWTGLTMAGA